MNYSFLFLGLPILLLNIPMEIIFSLTLLLISSFLYHNNEQDDSLFSELILIFDQMNIINMSCMISFQSFHFSIQYLTIYMLEKYILNGCWTCQFIYFLSFLNMIDLPILCFFIMNTFIYMSCQNRDFSSLERYLWHGSQSIYMILALQKLYSFRTFVPFFGTSSHRNHKEIAKNYT